MLHIPVMGHQILVRLPAASFRIMIFLELVLSYSMHTQHYKHLTADLWVLLFHKHLTMVSLVYDLRCSFFTERGQRKTSVVEPVYCSGHNDRLELGADLPSNHHAAVEITLGQSHFLSITAVTGLFGR